MKKLLCIVLLLSVFFVGFFTPVQASAAKLDNKVLVVFQEIREWEEDNTLSKFSVITDPRDLGLLFMHLITLTNYDAGMPDIETDAENWYHYMLDASLDFMANNFSVANPRADIKLADENDIVTAITATVAIGEYSQFFGWFQLYLLNHMIEAE